MTSGDMSCVCLCDTSNLFHSNLGAAGKDTRIQHASHRLRRPSRPDERQTGVLRPPQASTGPSNHSRRWTGLRSGSKNQPHKHHLGRAQMYGRSRERGERRSGKPQTRSTAKAGLAAVSTPTVLTGAQGTHTGPGPAPGSRGGPVRLEGALESTRKWLFKTLRHLKLAS